MAAILLGVVAVLLTLVVRANLWRALIFVWPSALFIDVEAPADAVKLPEALLPLDSALRPLGFVPLGSHCEKLPLRAETIVFDYGHAAERTFASLWLTPQQTPRLSFLTPTDKAAFVLTTNFRRPAREEPGHYIAGALENLPPERVFRAHLRRVPELGRAQAELTPEGRVEAARAWLAGPGRREMRQQNALGLLWTLGSLGMVGAAIFSAFK